MLLPWLMMLAIIIAALIYIGIHAKHAVDDFRSHRHYRP
jgi:hypothetical protein